MTVRRQKRAKQQQVEERDDLTLKQKLNFHLRRINPLTKNQELVFRNRSEHQLLYGSAGTGKTFLALYLALDDVIEKNLFKKIIIVRSILPVRNSGFMPGDDKQKSSYYEAPYIDICNDLFNRGDAYSILKAKGIIEFRNTAFIRGITFSDSIIIMDEMQNCCREECDSLLTRIGENSKIVICGDTRQDDLKRNREKSGFRDIIAIAKEMDCFKMVQFTFEDIVRSGFVKSFIIASAKLEAAGVIDVM